VNLVSIFLAIISGLGHTWAYVDYNKKVATGKTTPNGATWAIWATLALASSTSYVTASGDFWKSIISIINVVLCIWTFVGSLCKGKFKEPDVMELVALFLGVLSIIVWKASDAANANIVVQIAIIFGFVPTWRAVCQKHQCEHPKPWWIWSMSYCVATLVVYLRWRGQWIDLLYPVNCALLHASVPLLASTKGGLPMPIVDVKGLSEKTKTGRHELFSYLIKRVIASIPELGLKEEHITVFFPSYQYLSRPDKEVAIIVQLHQKPKRTDEVMKRMSDALRNQMKCFLPAGSLIEVEPIFSNPKHCSSTAE